MPKSRPGGVARDALMGAVPPPCMLGWRRRSLSHRVSIAEIPGNMPALLNASRGGWRPFIRGISVGITGGFQGKILFCLVKPAAAFAGRESSGCRVFWALQVGRSPLSAFVCAGSCGVLGGMRRTDAFLGGRAARRTRIFLQIPPMAEAHLWGEALPWPPALRLHKSASAAPAERAMRDFL